jgi:hypothetical protein
VRQDLGVAEGQLRDYQGRLGAAFPHASYLAELTSLRDRLKAGLSGGAATEKEGEPQPSVSELAEQIKSLKSAHTIEATPERAGKRRSSAEEPVTSRIRKRAGITQAADSVLESDVVPLPTERALLSASTRRRTVSAEGGRLR